MSKMGKNCDCDQWKASIDQIIGAQMLSSNHGFEYSGAPFKFCPWCGKELVEVANN